MKTVLCIITGSGFVWFATAGEVGPSLSREIPPPAVPNELSVVRKENREQDLPGLNYWGVRSVEWGAHRESIPEHIFDKQKKFQFANASFATELTFDQKTQGLTEIKYLAGPLSTNRAERLVEFSKVKQAFVDKYGKPNSVHANRLADSGAVYVNQTNKSSMLYQAEWNGPETVVSLELRVDQLSIHFRQAPNSKAEFIRRRLGQAGGQSTD